MTNMSVWIPLRSTSGRADADKVGRQQACTAHQTTVDIGLREQFRGIRCLDAAAVQQPRQTANHSILLHELATQEGVYLLGLLGAGGASGADRPDRLVGDHGGVER